MPGPKCLPESRASATPVQVSATAGCSPQGLRITSPPPAAGEPTSPCPAPSHTCAEASPWLSCIPNHCRLQNLSVSERLPGTYLSSLGSVCSDLLPMWPGLFGWICYSAPSLAHLLTTPSGTRVTFRAFFFPSALVSAQCHATASLEEGLMRSSIRCSSVDGALG